MELLVAIIGSIVGVLTLALESMQWWDSRRSHLVVDKMEFNIVEQGITA